jgi:hypothetical protein
MKMPDIPFGKHKGRSIEELLIAEPSYLWWLLSQNWVWIKYSELHQSIRSLGLELLATTPNAPAKAARD